MRRCLEALAVDNRWARFIILLLADPHTLEGRQRRKNRSSNPHGVLALWRSHNLHLDGSWSQRSHFLRHTLTDSREHGGTSRKNNVGIQVLSDINITLHDGLESAVSNTIHFKTSQVGLEQNLRTSESLVSNNNDVTIRQFKRLLQSRRLSSLLHLLLKVNSNETQGLLDVTNNFTLSSGCQRVTTLGQDLHQVISQVTTSKIHTHDSMGKGISLIDRNSVGNTISRIQNTPSGTSGGIQGKNSLDVHIHGGNVEGFKHDLGHSLSVGLRVHGGLGQQHRMGFRSNTKLIVEGVVPDLLHIIPVGDNSVLDGVLQSENTSLGLGFVSNIGITLFHSNHDTRLTGTTDQGRENGSGGIVSGESSFAHSGTVVNDKGGNIFVISHFDNLFGYYYFRNDVYNYGLRIALL
mmetsp:Transcript_24453/g.57797  ORF Transcript_24453/g.57797 Transcript_24453/m.57797 type:complete len:407 (+) Transcript_24453:178-1398(+)